MPDNHETLGRNGNQYLFDLISCKLVKATDKEVIKQRLVTYLVYELQVPVEMIFYNEKASVYGVGASMRFEVTINARVDKGLQALCSIAIIHNKNKDVLKFREKLEQISDEAGFYYVMVYDGSQIEMRMWDNEISQYIDLDKPLSFENMCYESNITHINSEQPYAFLDRSEDISLCYKELCESCLIGEDTESNKFEFVRLIARLLYGSNSNEYYDNAIYSDVRFSKAGNAGGGIWSVYYRFLVLSDTQIKETEAFTFSIHASAKTVNDPHWGSRRGESYLSVGIVDWRGQHNSLQLNVHKYVQDRTDTYLIWHDGSLTNGKKGACKRSEVLSFVEQYEPGLINENGLIHIGVLTKSTSENLRKDEFQVIISNLIKYARVRDKFRKERT